MYGILKVANKNSVKLDSGCMLKQLKVNLIMTKPHPDPEPAPGKKTPGAASKQDGSGVGIGGFCKWTHMMSH